MSGQRARAPPTPPVAEHQRAVSRRQRSCPPPPAAPRHCATQPATATATAAACQRRQSRRFRATISAGGSRCRWAATATTAQPTDRPLFYGRGETEPSPAPVPPPPPQAAAAAAVLPRYVLLAAVISRSRRRLAHTGCERISALLRPLQNQHRNLCAGTANTSPPRTDHRLTAAAHRSPH